MDLFPSIVVQTISLGVGWTDPQSVTYFRNALKGPMIQWFNGLKIVRTIAITWDYLREKFERDVRAAPTVSKVISQLPEIKQMDRENVNHYFNRCIRILASLKERTCKEVFSIKQCFLHKPSVSE